MITVEWWYVIFLHNIVAVDIIISPEVRLYFVRINESISIFFIEHVLEFTIICDKVCDDILFEVENEKESPDSNVSQ